MQPCIRVDRMIEKVIVRSLQARHLVTIDTPTLIDKVIDRLIDKYL